MTDETEEADARTDPRPGDMWSAPDGRRITIMRIEGTLVHYDALTREGTMWSSRETVPLPLGWGLVRREPKPVPKPEVCIVHPLREREAGTLYCPECVEQQVMRWADLTPEQARIWTQQLIELGTEAEKP